MVKPVQRREVVKHLVCVDRLSERRACELAGISRTVYRYCPKRPEKDEDLKATLLELAQQYPRYGYLMLHALLRNMGMKVNKKRIYRLYKELGLSLPRKRRKKLNRQHSPMTLPSGSGERLSMDFIHDQLEDGTRFRVLNIIDDFSRECVGQLVDTSITGERVARFLDQLVSARGRPQAIVCDNGTEFTSKAMFFWSRDNQVKLEFIQPGKPVQNAFVESFNGKFRDTCLNQYWFRSLYEARDVIEQWRQDYNEVRPHSSLGYQPPGVFAREMA